MLSRPCGSTLLGHSRTSHVSLQPPEYGPSFIYDCSKLNQLLGVFILCELELCFYLGVTLEKVSVMASLVHAKLGLVRAVASLFAVYQADALAAAGSSSGGGSGKGAAAPTKGASAKGSQPAAAAAAAKDGGAAALVEGSVTMLSNCLMQYTELASSSAAKVVFVSWGAPELAAAVLQVRGCWERCGGCQCAGCVR